jgi:GNAT-family acetyltransferase (TIGR03103 family)
VNDRPDGYDRANVYTTIIVDEALRRGIAVELLDPATGEMRMRLGDHVVDMIQSLPDLTSAVAHRRCDDKSVTRRVLGEAGLPLPAGAVATDGPSDAAFLERHGDVVVKPARGEGGEGITVGVRDPYQLGVAVDRARRTCASVLLEERLPGDDLRVLVIADQVVAAAVRRPPVVVGDGENTLRDLIDASNATRDPGLQIPVDAITDVALRDEALTLDDVPAAGRTVVVRATANLHTGGTIHDVTDELHPDHAAVARRAASALDLPVAGVDLMVAAHDRPGQHVIEVNEQPGLANHEPRPTAQRYLDLLFPETAS